MYITIRAKKVASPVTALQKCTTDSLSFVAAVSSCKKICGNWMQL